METAGSLRNPETRRHISTSSVLRANRLRQNKVLTLNIKKIIKLSKHILREGIFSKQNVSGTVKKRPHLYAIKYVFVVIYIYLIHEIILIFIIFFFRISFHFLGVDKEHLIYNVHATPPGHFCSRDKFSRHTPAPNRSNKLSTIKSFTVLLVKSCCNKFCNKFCKYI